MFPLKITPEQYVQYHSPAPDYLYAVRELTHDRYGSVVIPDKIIQGSLKFLGVAKVLKVSPYKSGDEQVEYVKEILRKVKYITFEFHATAEVQTMPQFEFEKGVSIVQLHAKDVTGYGENLEALIQLQEEHERKHSGVININR